MFKQWLGVLSALLLASCANKPETKDDAPPDTGVVEASKKEKPAAKPDPREVTFHVDGMAERLKLI